MIKILKDTTFDKIPIGDVFGFCKDYIYYKISNDDVLLLAMTRKEGDGMYWANTGDIFSPFLLCSRVAKLSKLTQELWKG